MGMRGNNDNSSSTIVVTVKKDELISILTANRDKHINEYKAACEVYKAKVLDEAKKAETQIIAFQAAWKVANFDKLPKFPDVYSFQQLPKPVSYEDSYTRALGMLKLHTKDEMTLDLQTYRQYVEDDWEWSASAKLSNSRYLGG